MRLGDHPQPQFADKLELFRGADRAVLYSVARHYSGRFEAVQGIHQFSAGNAVNGDAALLRMGRAYLRNQRIEVGKPGLQQVYFQLPRVSKVLSRHSSRAPAPIIRTRCSSAPSACRPWKSCHSSGPLPGVVSVSPVTP